MKIDIAEETFALLKELAEPLVDTPDSVIMRLAKAELERRRQKNGGSEIEHPKFIDVQIGPEKCYEQKYALIPLKHQIRHFFPGYKTPFVLETDTGPVTTMVTSASRGATIGDPVLGKYIMGGLRDWYARHRDELRNGGTLRIHELEPFKRYRLEVANPAKQHTERT